MSIGTGEQAVAVQRLMRSVPATAVPASHPRCVAGAAGNATCFLSRCHPVVTNAVDCEPPGWTGSVKLCVTCLPMRLLRASGGFGADVLQTWLT